MAKTVAASVNDVVAVKETGIITVKKNASVFKTVKKAAAKVANSVINGTAKSDILYGTNKNDTINGKGGSDKLYGGWGDDTLKGGAGVDTLYGGEGDDKLYGEAGNDKLYGNDGDDYLDGGAGVDKMYGGDGDDKLYGKDGEDRLYGGAGDDKLYGQDGIDRLYGGDGDDTLYGNAGDDKLYGGDGEDILYGGAGDDRIFGGGGADTFVYVNGEGNDYIQDYQLCDTITISKGTISEIRWKSWGNDPVLTIGNGSVRIRDLGDRRIMFKDSFNTTGYLYVRRNSNFAYSQGSKRGFNQLTFDANFKGTINAKEFFGEGKADSGRYTHIELDDYSKTEANNIRINGTEDENVIMAGHGNDIVYGYGSGDTLYGGKGNDKLYGGAGDDSLYGGSGGYYGEKDIDTAGNDELWGGAGDNWLCGGAGNDTFGFEAASTGYNTIADYLTGADIIAFKDNVSISNGFADEDDVILELSNNGTINIIGAAGKEITFNNNGTVTKQTFN